MDLVLEGGGVKGVGLVGAYAVLEERGYHPENIAGASAGAIVAALIAAGYSAKELREIIGGLDYSRFRDKGWEDRVPFAWEPLSVLKDLGIYEGAYLGEWLAGLLRAKGVETFADLRRRPDAPEPRYRHKLQVIASDLTEKRLLVLPRDAGFLGLRPDELDVAQAVRMSMSIPIFFEPVRFTNKRSGRVHLIVDGGMLSNFPVWLFDSDEPLWPTIGLKLVEPNTRAPLSSAGPGVQTTGTRSGAGAAVYAYLRSLVDTMMEAHDRMYLEEHDFARTIPVDTLGVRTTEFDLSSERAALLYESGRQAALRFLDSGGDL